MKTLILSLSIILISSLGIAQTTEKNIPDSCSYTSKDLKVSIHKDTNKMVNVQLTKYPGELVIVRVKEDNKVISTKRIKKYASANLKYDIAELPKGTYKFEIVKNNTVVFSQKLQNTESAELYAQRK